MREIKILLRNLRNYPDNFFVVVEDVVIEGKDREPGLKVVDVRGNEQGYIEIGLGIDKVIIE